LKVPHLNAEIASLASETQQQLAIAYAREEIARQ
jgi:hypothetical protein